MAKVTISPEAEHDAAEIVALLTAEAGASVARRYRRDFDDLFERFAMFPLSGARRPRLGRTIRIGVVSPYVAIYEFDQDHVVILRIIDGRRRIARGLIGR